MRAIALCLLALVAVASARNLQQGTVSTTCKTESTASLNLVGGGSQGRAQGQSFCQAEADARSAIEKVISEYIVAVFDDAANACTEAKASEAATGIAKAIASAYTSVTAKVEVTGTGEACASGFAAGDALAIAVVDITLELSVKLIEDKYPMKTYGKDVAKAVNEKRDEASGLATGRAVAKVISTAWSAAAAEACTTGGFDKDFEENYVKSISIAVAELWATVVVELCSKFDNAKNDELKQWQEKTSGSFSDIAGQIDVTGETTVSPGGVGSGTAGEFDACAAPKDACCRDTYVGSTTCDCGGATGCSMEIFSTAGLAGKTVWRDSTSGALCSCN